MYINIAVQCLYFFIGAVFSSVEENLVSADIAQLTPVQMQVIPAVLAGRDVLACSATGSGKSEIKNKMENMIVFFVSSSSVVFATNSATPVFRH